MEKTKTTLYPEQVAHLEELIFGPPPVWKDWVFKTGLTLIGLSGLLFCLPELKGITLERDNFLGIFFLHYAFSAGYFLLLLFSGLLRFRRKTPKNYTENLFLFLVLGLISAFALNREIPVFETSATWLAAFLVTLCAALITVCFRRKLPEPVTVGLYFLLGAGLILHLYFSFYLVPLYMIGLLGAVALGFSLHVFVPLFSLLIIGAHVYAEARKSKAIKYAVVSGLTLPLVTLGFFLLGWENIRTQINYALNESSLTADPLPKWVAVSRSLPATPLAEKVIKTDLIYSTPSNSFFGNWMNLPNRSFGETRKHDPLVMISCLLLGKPELTEDERIKILEAMYDSRHKAQERLWRGEHLQTTNVTSNVLIYPEFLMAYTEKVLSIKNTEAREWSQQEAIYTFHLPEGGVVTSLSLWINGQEEKGILTTKAKADSAYKTIVGVEARDPSVVHWQEGNRVTVRVFPCTPQENRQFKIGVTAPLQKAGNKLLYQNLYFDGPETVNATESVQVKFSQKPEELELPFSFSTQNPTVFTANRGYRPYWEIEMKAPELSTAGFSFDGHTYKVQEYRKQYAAFQPEKIYLDLNNSWTSDELYALWDVLKDRPVYVYQQEMVRLTAENLETVFKALQKQNFSLFPFHKIQDPARALVISKSGAVSPNLKDLQGSYFSEGLTRALQRPEKIRLYNLGTELSPYLKTLKELRTFAYDFGSVPELETLLKKQQFVQSQENERTVVIDNASLMLTEIPGLETSAAPDHLLRLFTYNHLMQQIARDYFTDNFKNEPIIAAAQKAYVVSPVSSLIVLETQQDYDRFNIHDSANKSLRNASMHGAGSVPEPHEWFLIIMVATVAVYLYFRPKFDLKPNR